MLNRLPTFASAAILALSLSAPAFAQNNSWGNANNGYGYYHESNGTAMGWGSAETCNGLYHQSNSSATKKPVQGK